MYPHIVIARSVHLYVPGKTGSHLTSDHTRPERFATVRYRRILSPSCTLGRTQEGELVTTTHQRSVEGYNPETRVLLGPRQGTDPNVQTSPLHLVTPRE